MLLTCSSQNTLQLVSVTWVMATKSTDDRCWKFKLCCASCCGRHLSKAGHFTYSQFKVQRSRDRTGTTPTSQLGDRQVGKCVMNATHTFNVGRSMFVSISLCQSIGLNTPIRWSHRIPVSQVMWHSVYEIFHDISVVVTFYLAIYSLGRLWVSRFKCYFMHGIQLDLLSHQELYY